MNVSEQKFPISPVEHFVLSPQVAVTNSGVVSVFDYIYIHTHTHTRSVIL